MATRKKLTPQKTTPEPLFTKRLLTIFAMIAVILLIAVVTSLQAPKPTPDAGKAVTMYGVMACLPHKGDGPHTMECAQGFREEGGAIYAIRDAHGHLTSDTHKKIRIKGMLQTTIPDELKRYDIKGVIESQQIEVVGE